MHSMTNILLFCIQSVVYLVRRKKGETIKGNIYQTKFFFFFFLGGGELVQLIYEVNTVAALENTNNHFFFLCKRRCEMLSLSFHLMLGFCSCTKRF